eukprot:COSAG05_NODE_1116_length_5825_cov_11.050304_6_plen_65_part_00
MCTQVPCHDHTGRWCGLEGTIVDMLQRGVTIDKVATLRPLSHILRSYLSWMPQIEPWGIRVKTN